MKIVIFLTFLVFGLFFYACQSNEIPSQPLTLDEVISGGESTALSTIDTLIPTAPIDENFQLILSDLKIEADSVVPIDTLLFVDRYNNHYSFKYALKQAKKTTFIAYWKFKNQSLAKNAFLNWTQCYGKNCSSLKINDTIGVSNEKMGMLLGDNYLYYMHNISQKSYKDFVQKIIENQKNKIISFAFYQNGKKEMQWFDTADFIP